MGEEYLIDTNVVIDHLGNKLPEKGKKFIVATALVHDLILITHNTSDFKNIDGLKVIDPYMINNSAISSQLPDNQ